MATTKRKSHLTIILILAALVAAGILYYVCDPRDASVPFLKCPFHWLTGLNCPGCGLQRMIHCLLHGDIAGAFHYNAMAFVFLPILVLLALAEWCNYHHWFDWVNRWVNHRYTPLVLLALCLGWWIVRNILGI